LRKDFDTCDQYSQQENFFHVASFEASPLIPLRRRGRPGPE
jgi:hypothetical protein